MTEIFQNNAKLAIPIVTSMTVLIRLVFCFCFYNGKKHKKLVWSQHTAILSVGCLDHHGRWSLGGEYLLIKKFLYP